MLNLIDERSKLVNKVNRTPHAGSAKKLINHFGIYFMEFTLKQFRLNKSDRGVSSIEMPFVFVLFIILMVGVFEIGNYVQMASAIKNHATTMTITISHIDVPTVQLQYPTIQEGMTQSMQNIINQTGSYLQEYIANYKVIAQISSNDPAFPTSMVRAGTLAVPPDNFESFRRPNECRDLTVGFPAASYLGVVHTQICIDFRSRVGKLLGAFSPDLAVICRSACMIMVSKLPPPPPPCTTGCYPSPGSAPASGGEGCANGTCRELNKVDIHGYSVKGVCGGQTCDKVADYDDMYVDLGTVGTSAGVPIMISYGTCNGPARTDCSGQCDCAAGSAPGAKANISAACSIKTSFSIELGHNSCNTDKNDKGYASDASNVTLSDVKWDYSDMEECSYTPSHWETWSCGCDCSYPVCVSEATVQSTRCVKKSNKWTTPKCPVTKRQAYRDCCEGECGLDGGTAGRCTACKGKRNNNHCQPGCNATFDGSLCGN